jgi:predicted NBD/HSP70 family sugar kinase
VALVETTAGARSPNDFVLAIDFGGTKIDVGSAGRDGELILSDRIDTQASQGAAQAVERALELAGDIGARTREQTGGRCLAVGAVSPGIIQEDGVLLAPNVPGWGELALPARVREALGVADVAVANDVNAAALAEARWGALAGADPGVLISLGTGIKAGIVIGGQVFTGAHGGAGEIGYSLRDAADATGFADGRAPLEEFVGGRAIGERAGRALGLELTAADAFTRSDLPAGFIAATLSELGMHVANLAIALDPARIAIGGGLMAHDDVILPAVRSWIARAVPFAPDVVPARFLHDGALRGAAALALNASAAPVELSEAAR